MYCLEFVTRISMDISLERGDLLQLDAITNRGTLKLLPVGKKGKQKLVVGDDSGQVHCYEFKKGEPQLVFSSKIFEDAVTAVSVGGGTVKKDNMFVASGQKIVGLTKKGKDFFKLTSSLTETINHIYVDDTKLWTGCEFIYNLYVNGAERDFYMCKDIINDMVVDHYTRELEYDVVFGCQDSCLRFVSGSQLLLEMPTESSVTVLCDNTGFSGVVMSLLQQQHMDSTAPLTVRPEQFGSRYIVYGMENGTISMEHIQYNNPKTSPGIVPVLTNMCCWKVADWNRKRISAVTAISVCDINRDNVGEIVVGRDDGRIEVYLQTNCMNHSNGNVKKFSPPQMIFSREINESIRSIDCGLVNSTEFYEIIIAAYSGKIISFTTEAVNERAQDDKHGRSVQTVNDENRIKFLKAEIDQLKNKVSYLGQ